VNAERIAHKLITNEINALLDDVVGIWEYLETADPDTWERLSLRQQEALVVDVEHWLRHYKEEWEK
jgi:hypothetical protein